MLKIAVFIGSLQEKSHNKMLAKALELAAPEGVVFDYIDINLPLFNQDLEADYPADAQRVKMAVESADGVLFVTPEYNRSVPGVLKNAIDWASRPYGKNSFVRKPVGVVGASIGPVGTAIAQADIRHIMSFLDAKALGQPEIHMANASGFFNEAGELTDERWLKNVAAYMAAFADWVESEK